MLNRTVGERPRVLVVEDDAGIADAVVYALERDGMAAVCAGTLAATRRASPGVDLAILDLVLPDGSGFTLLREWRSGGATPAVIVLTSRDAEVDCVAALEAGADDFVAKPFSPRSLVARVRAVLRRGRAGDVAPVFARAQGVGLHVDLERRSATYDGQPVALTKIELDLLAALASSPGRVLTREQLVRRVWGDGYAITERTIDSHVKGLRRKLGDAGAAASLVSAVRGVGFKLSEAT
ncbi:MAG: winged helix-turn-helix domain-containing protein [Polyangiaceae bacterium]